MSISDLQKIIARIDDLPTLPRTVLKITELVNDPQSSAKDIARIITDDQVLTGELRVSVKECPKTPLSGYSRCSVCLLF